MTALNVHTVNWREHVGRAVLDPNDPHGTSLNTATDRRMLWEIESRLAVTATTDSLRDTHTVLLAYLRDTCTHHWTESTDYDDRPLRQCLWCHQTEWRTEAGWTETPEQRRDEAGGAAEGESA